MTWLESWLVREIIPKWPQFRLVKYYNLPRYIANRPLDFFFFQDAFAPCRGRWASCPLLRKCHVPWRSCGRRNGERLDENPWELIPWEILWEIHGKSMGNSMKIFHLYEWIFPKMDHNGMEIPRETYFCHLREFILNEIRNYNGDICYFMFGNDMGMFDERYKWCPTNLGTCLGATIWHY